MIDFSIEQDGQRLQDFLNGLGPRLMAEVQQALKLWLYQGVQAGVQKYFAGSGPKRGATTTLLTSRSGALVNSLLLSAETGVSADSGQVTASFGSTLPYARIQEYGGAAGRPGPFKKKNGRRPYLPPRPYLQPIFEDLQAGLSDVLDQAAHSALTSP